MAAAPKFRAVLSTLAAVVVVSIGMFAVPAPAQAGGTTIVVARPGVFVVTGDRHHRRYSRHYDSRYRDFRYRDYDRGYRYRDYDRYRYRDRSYYRGFDRGYGRRFYRGYRGDCRYRY